MAIAYDAASNGADSATGTVTWSHTCGGSNRMLFVGVFIIGVDNISTVKYNTVSMTQIGKKTMPTSGNTIYLYALQNPDTGAHTVEIVQAYPTAIFAGCSVSYTGVKQSITLDASGTAVNETASSPYQQSLNSVADNCWHIMAYSGVARTSTAQDTSRANNANTYLQMEDKNSAKTPAGSVTLGYTFTGGTNISASVMASFAPYVPPGPINVKTFNGLAAASVKTVNGLAIASVKAKNGLA